MFYTDTKVIRHHRRVIDIKSHRSCKHSPKIVCLVILAILSIRCNWIFVKVTTTSQSFNFLSIDNSTSKDSSINSRKEDDVEVNWEWKRFRNITHPSNNLLISQYDSGMDVYYATLLNISKRVNQAYASKYHFDYVALHGIAFRTPYDTWRVPRPSRATYNKISIVEKAIELNYDYLLILDSDAMMYDFTRDISELIPSDRLIMAHKVYKRGFHFSVNIGVILWNLRHPMIKTVVKRWKDICTAQVFLGISDNDQNPLQRLLQVMGPRKFIQGNRNEFAYNEGEFVKHFKRKNSRSWKNANTDQRANEMQSIADEVCYRHQPACSIANSNIKYNVQ
jgi:hypothetical protein